MAIFTDGFDYYDSAAIQNLIWNYASNSTSYHNYSAAGSGVFSYGRSFWVSGGDDQPLRHSLAANIGTWYLGFHFKVENTGASNSSLFSFYDSTSVQCCVRVVVSGANLFFEMRRGAFNGTVVATGSVSISYSTWYWLAAKVVLHGSTGTVTVKLNGVDFLSATGLNNISTANAYAQSIQLGAGGEKQCYFDNFHVYDGTDAAPFDDYLTERRIYFFMPSGDGAQTDFTPSTGSRYQCIDENPPNTTDYIYSSTAGHQNGVVIADLATGLTPELVKLTGYVYKDDASARVVKLYNKQSATFYYGSDESLTNAWKMISKTWLTNPAGGSWDKTAVDASEWGIEVVS